MSNNMTFHCRLILQNDADCYDDTQCLTTHVMANVYHDRHGRAFEDQRRVRIYILTQYLREYIEEITDKDNGYNPMTSELLLGALQEVNFREIAEDLISDYSPKSPEETANYEEYFHIRGFDNYDIDED